MMIDIETTGVSPINDDVLQIGILECIKNSRGFYVPARSFNKILHFDDVVTDPWILKTHSTLLPLCRMAPYESPTEVRAQILAFFHQCDITEKANLMGLNAGMFDIPALVSHGFLKTEDIHYRVYELTGAFNLAQDVLGLERRDQLFKVANDACDWVAPSGTKHDAIYDCYSQLKALNGCIKLLQTKGN